MNNKDKMPDLYVDIERRPNGKLVWQERFSFIKDELFSEHYVPYSSIQSSEQRVKELQDQLSLANEAIKMFMEVGDQCSRGYLAGCHKKANEFFQQITSSKSGGEG